MNAVPRAAGLSLASAPALPPDGHVIAIPARDEAALLPDLLDSIDRAAARAGVAAHSLVYANNCSDRTAGIARAMRPAAPGHRIGVIEARLDHARANAGGARRAALDLALTLCPHDGVILTTDADAIVDPGWLIAARAGIMAGADLVCGTVRTALPDAFHDLGSCRRAAMAEAGYAPMLHELRHAYEVLSGRGWQARVPHYVESGACMAIRAEMLRRIGGLPDRAESEDRALAHAVHAAGGRVLYSDEMTAFVSGRFDARSVGGMGDCLRHRMTDPDPLADQSMLDPATLRRIWEFRGPGAQPWPTRAEPQVQRLRSSDLEAMAPDLARLLEQEVRPALAAHFAEHAHGR